MINYYELDGTKIWTYLVHQPKNLEHLAMVKLAEWITLQARKWISQEPNHYKKKACRLKGETNAKRAEEINNRLSQKIEVIRNLIECNVSRTLHNELLIILLKSLQKLQYKFNLNWYTNNSKKFVYLSITGALFTKYLTTIRIYNGALLTLKIPIFSKAYLLSGLTCLEFGSYNLFNSANEPEIINMLKSLPNLQDFTLQTIFTDKILNCLLEHCKFIEKLNLMCSKEINDTSVHILTQFLNLKHVDFTNTSVTKLGIAHLLTSCKNIEVIININYWSNKIAPAIEYIASIKENVGMQLQLKSYLNNRDTNYTQLTFVIQMCPQIQKLKLTKYSLQGSLSILKKLQNLKELVLEEFDFHGDGISEVLDESGHKLTHLQLIAINQIDFNDLIYVCKKCPNLETLVFRSAILPDSYHSDGTLKFLPLRRLKAFVFQPYRRIKYGAEREFIFLLSNCPNVHFIRSSVSLTDDIMMKVLDKNPLIYLQKFKMLNCNLSVAVIDRIIQNCIVPPILINYFGHTINEDPEFPFTLSLSSDINQM